MLKPLMRSWISARMRRAVFNWQSSPDVSTISVTLKDPASGAVNGGIQNASERAEAAAGLS